MQEYETNKDYLKHAIAVLELMATQKAKFTAIYEAAGDYWLIIRKDFINRGICRPIGNDGRSVMPDKFAMIGPTLAHYRYIYSEMEKQEKDRRLDVRIKKSGAWTGWIAIIISSISLSVSLCSRDRELQEISPGSGTSYVPDVRMSPDSLDNRSLNNRATQSERTTCDTNTKADGDSAVSSKAQ